jgi:hypothetical protein
VKKLNLQPTIYDNEKNTLSCTSNIICASRIWISAAFYSVYGLSKLFAGASTQVIIMAGSLEFAKLVVASLSISILGHYK